MRRLAIFGNLDLPKCVQNVLKKSNLLTKSVFVEDFLRMFHPFIPGAAVFRRCILDRIPKLAEETQDSAKPAIAQQMVPNFPGSGVFHWMVFGIPPYISL